MKKHASSELDIFLGEHELIISRKYDFYYNVNDIFISLWFLIGSILFFWSSTQNAGIWLFILGSIQLFIRPVIRITKNIHLEKLKAK